MYATEPVGRELTERSVFLQVFPLPAGYGKAFPVTGRFATVAEDGNVVTLVFMGTSKIFPIEIQHYL
jgi:hypothetical protein